MTEKRPRWYGELWDGAWLKEQYEEKERTIPEIAATIGCSVMAVHKALVRFNIPRRKPGVIRTTHQRTDASFPMDENGRRRKRYHSGYVRIHAPEHPKADSRGYVPEHRWVVEQALGVVLPEGTAVHHINGRRDDNDINNLAVCLSNRAHKLLDHRCKKGSN
jgi:hypothetical protein